MEEALLKLGALYMEERKFSEARQVYQKLLEKTKREDRREVAKKNARSDSSRDCSLMEKGSKRGSTVHVPLLIAGLLVVVGFLSWVFFFTPTLQSRLGWGWKILTKESKRILGWEKGEIPPEEKRIREEVILKKMEEASAHQDWRSLPLNTLGRKR